MSRYVLGGRDWYAQDLTGASPNLRYQLGGRLNQFDADLPIALLSQHK